MTPLESAKGKLSFAYIREKTEKYYWKSFLTNYIQSIPYDETESEISFGKVPTGYKELVELKKNIDHLKDNSNLIIKNSYFFKEKQVTTRESTQTIPEKVLFETEESLLLFLRKTQEAKLARANYENICKNLPELSDWIIKHTDKLIEIEEKSNWTDIIKVARYFLDSHIPNKYFVRELKIEVHSKFIEDNKTYLKEILNTILPESKINQEESNFALRFGCLLPEDTIRVKFLDPELKVKYKIPFIDFSIPLSEFINLNFQNCNILILENKTNFYLLQGEFYFKNTVAIFGSGFGALTYKDKNEDKTLKPIEWLTNNRIFYWGDMDSAGFEILSKFRHTYPHAVSIFMDKQTYITFEAFAHNIDPGIKEIPKLPSKEDCDLYSFIKQNNLRLEQEILTHEYIKQGLEQML